MSRPAATTSAPPTTIAPRSPPCRKASPVDRLAHVLVYPEQDTKAHRAVTAADLQRLLDPDNEPFAKTTKLPPLPAYGPDPYNGGARSCFRKPHSPLRRRIRPDCTPVRSPARPRRPRSNAVVARSRRDHQSASAIAHSPVLRSWQRSGRFSVGELPRTRLGSPHRPFRT